MTIRKTVVLVSTCAAFAVTASPAAARSGGSEAATLLAVETAVPPVIDGKADDAAWANAKPFVTYDPLAKVKLTVRAVHTKDSIYILATFPDTTENRRHKTQEWVADQSRYRISTDREDTFVIKWGMGLNHQNLRVDAEEPYRADIWYWKSHRTDHAGYADDKMHIYSSLKIPNSKSLVSRNGLRFYLTRPGDAGKAAYQTIVHGEHVGDRTTLYRQVTPQGSRADVRAKGVWRNGTWTVEFARKLSTGNPDDVEFDIRQAYAFGVSRYEIAGRRVNRKLQEPYFGAGEITELATLRFR